MNYNEYKKSLIELGDTLTLSDGTIHKAKKIRSTVNLPCVSCSLLSHDCRTIKCEDKFYFKLQSDES